ncbi:MAG: ABC transporter permease subunit, partial [Eggerthellaceae bacterium]
MRSIIGALPLFRANGSPKSSCRPRRRHVLPKIALAATFVVVFGTNVPSLIFAIGFLYIPQIARIVRANIVSEYNQDYVRAVVVSGARAPWILIKHVVRNCIAPVMVFTIVLVADAIVFEASLAFI